MGETILSDDVNVSFKGNTEFRFDDDDCVIGVLEEDGSGDEEILSADEESVEEEHVDSVHCICEQDCTLCKRVHFAEMTEDDLQTSREGSCFRFWINSLGIGSYVHDVFEDVRNGWVLLEVLDKISPGSVNWKQATKPPIEMPFRKVENCNQALKIGKQLEFSLVNVAGNDIVQGNKKLILAFLWQLMRYNLLQLLRSKSHWWGVTDSDILNWANYKVKSSGRKSLMENFEDKSISNGLFFLELLSAVEPKVVDWNLVTKGATDDEKRSNAMYIISVTRKLGCSVFILPEDIMQVNLKPILTLIASLMYWCLEQEGTKSYQSPHSETAASDSSASLLVDNIEDVQCRFENLWVSVPRVQ